MNINKNRKKSAWVVAAVMTMTMAVPQISFAFSTADAVNSTTFHNVDDYGKN